MNIYLISQSKNYDLDTFDSAVVVAPDEETARRTHPDGSFALTGDYFDHWSAETWVENINDVVVQLIGQTDENYKVSQPWVVCASFNLS